MTSKNTSLNQVAALLKKVPWEGGEINLDYGGGKYDKGTEYLWVNHSVINLVYDPYNRPYIHNEDVKKFVKAHGGADTVTCANVLNVIADPMERYEVLLDISKNLKLDGKAYFTVYEGDGSGVGRVTKPDCWQENRPTASYIPEIQQAFNTVYRMGKVIVAYL